MRRRKRSRRLKARMKLDQVSIVRLSRVLGFSPHLIGDDDKYTKEDTPRRIFVKHIDRKKNADDIEDYFFDTYKDTGLEDVYTCTVYNARSQRRMFFGNVILTFDTEANAKVRVTIIISDLL